MINIKGVSRRNIKNKIKNLVRKSNIKIGRTKRHTKKGIMIGKNWKDIKEEIKTELIFSSFGKIIFKFTKRKMNTKKKNI